MNDGSHSETKIRGKCYNMTLLLRDDSLTQRSFSAAAAFATTSALNTPSSNDSVCFEKLPEEETELMASLEQMEEVAVCSDSRLETSVAPVAEMTKVMWDAADAGEVGSLVSTGSGIGPSLTETVISATPQLEISGDVVMENATSSASVSPGPLNDEGLPAWLTPMIAYLRGVSDDGAWQSLVTRFVNFEKCRPPLGVRTFTFSFMH